jgi:hypothetical protein
MFDRCTNRLRPTRRSLLALFATFVGGVMMLLASPAAAGPPVDPSTLEPEPPNAVCREDGRQVICDTFFIEDVVNEPIADFDLPCGTIYETSHFRGDGTRWYVDGKVVRRHNSASVDGSWSLSPTGAGPTVKISGHWSIQTVWTTPGDDSTQVDSSSSGSDFKISAPGFGVIIHGAGLSYPDGTHHGTATEFPFPPETEAALCAALTS